MHRGSKNPSTIHLYILIVLLGVKYCTLSCLGRGALESDHRARDPAPPLCVGAIRTLQGSNLVVLLSSKASKHPGFSELDTDVKMNESVFEWWLWLELCVWVSLASTSHGARQRSSQSFVFGSCGCFFIWSIKNKERVWQPIFRFMASRSLTAKIPLSTSNRTALSLKGDY